MTNEEVLPLAGSKSEHSETPESYFFVGSDSKLEGPGYVHDLTSFGQEVKLLPSQAVIHAAHGARLVPECPFHEIGFSKQELDANTNARLHNDNHPDPAFMEKRKQAIAAADAFQAESIEVLAKEIE